MLRVIGNLCAPATDRERRARSIGIIRFEKSSFAFRQRATLSIAQIKKLPSLSFGSFVLRGTRTSLFFFPSFFIVSFFFLSFLLLFLFRAAVIVGKYRGNSVESNEPSGFAERIQRDKIRRRDGVTVIEGKPNKARLIVHPRITRGKDERSSRARIYTHSFTPIDHTLRRAKIRHAKVPLNYSSVRECALEKLQDARFVFLYLLPGFNAQSLRVCRLYRSKVS